jgi:hypothetical protein
MQVLWMVLVTLDWRCAGPGARAGGTRCREDQAPLSSHQAVNRTAQPLGGGARRIGFPCLFHYARAY